MFTKFEIGIMATALERYEGVYGYGKHENLTDAEIERHNKSLDTARSLAERFREIQMEDYAEQRKVEGLIARTPQEDR